MLLTIAIILAVAWLLGLSFSFAGGAIHLLLIVAVGILAWNFLAGRTARA